MLLNIFKACWFVILDRLPPSIGILTGIIHAFIENPIHVLKTFFGRKEFTPPKLGRNSIATIKSIFINGAWHSVIIRGDDINLPLLLVLHGGPGGTDIPFYSSYSQLESHFIVIHYDQRGACKSYALNMKNKIPNFESTLTIDQHIADAIAISEWLLDTNKSGLSSAKTKGMYLFGGSWGSMLGLFLLKARPDLFKRAIFRGVCTNSIMSEEIGMNFILSQMKKFKFSQFEISRVASLGPPYGNAEDLIEQRRWLNAMGGSVYKHLALNAPVARWRLEHDTAYSLVLSPEMTLSEIISMRFGVVSSLKTMWPAVQVMDMASEVLVIDVPVAFVHGRHDNCTVYSLVEGFITGLKAPRKAFVTFEKSGHSPQKEEAQHFVDFALYALLDIQLPSSFPYEARVIP